MLNIFFQHIKRTYLLNKKVYIIPFVILFSYLFVTFFFTRPKTINDLKLTDYKNSPELFSIVSMIKNDKIIMTRETTGGSDSYQTEYIVPDNLKKSKRLLYILTCCFNTKSSKSKQLFHYLYSCIKKKKFPSLYDLQQGKYYDDPYAQLHLNALTVLQQLTLQESQKLLVKLANNSENPEIQLRALQILPINKKYLPLYSKLYNKSPHQSIRHFALLRIAQVAPKKGAEFAIQILKHTSKTSQKVYAIYVLSRLTKYKPQSINEETLFNIYKKIIATNKDEKVLSPIVYDLSQPFFIKYHKKEILDIYLKLFKSTRSIWTKINIIKNLAKLHTSKGNLFIFDHATSNSNPQIRYVAVKTYLSKKKEIPLDELKKMAEGTKEISILELIAQELLKYNSKESNIILTDIFLKADDTPRESLPSLLAESLKKRDNRLLTSLLIKKIQNARDSELKNIIKTLAYTNNNTSYKTLIKLLKNHPKKIIRQQVACSLGDSNYKQAYLPLTHTMLYDKNEDVQDEALDAVYNFDIKKVIKELKRIQQVDTSPEVQKNIKIALKELEENL